MKKRIMKKFVASLTVLSLTVGTLPFSAFAAPVVQGHWAAAYVNKLVQQNVLTGYDDGSMKLDEKITRAEFITMLNKVFGFVEKDKSTFKDIKADDWFLAEMQKATKAGYIAGYTDGTAKPNAPITRQEAATAMWKAFGLAAGDESDLDFEDNSSIQQYAKLAVASLVSQGIVSGYPDGSFKPTGNITRAEAATIVSRFANDIFSKAGTYKAAPSKEYNNVIVNTPNVVLENMTIDGDLYIAPGVDEGDVSLNNVVVNGTTFVKGGGINSIKVKDSKLQNVMVHKMNNMPVRLVAEGKTDIGTTTLESSAKLVELNLTGNTAGFGNVEVAQKGSSTVALTLDGKFATVVLGGKVDMQLLSGIIDKLETLKDARITAKVEKGAVVTLIKALVAFVLNGVTVAEGKDASVSSTGSVTVDGITTTPTTTGGGGGGGTSGGGDTNTPNPTNVVVSKVSVVPDSIAVGEKTVATVTGVRLNDTVKVALYDANDKLVAVGTSLAITAVTGATADASQFNRIFEINPKTGFVAGDYKVYATVGTTKTTVFTALTVTGTTNPELTVSDVTVAPNPIKVGDTTVATVSGTHMDDTVQVALYKNDAQVEIGANLEITVKDTSTATSRMFDITPKNAFVATDYEVFVVLAGEKTTTSTALTVNSATTGTTAEINSIIATDTALTITPGSIGVTGVSSGALGVTIEGNNLDPAKIKVQVWNADLTVQMTTDDGLEIDMDSNFNPTNTTVKYMITGYASLVHNTHYKIVVLLNDEQQTDKIVDFQVKHDPAPSPSPALLLKAQSSPKKIKTLES